MEQHRNHKGYYISIHAPSRERPIATGDVYGTTYFNPRSLTGATVIYKQRKEFSYISIHAPSRERLVTPLFILIIQNISIHAPSRERQVFPTPQPFRCYFNPRSLTGATMMFNGLCYCVPVISIHAPSRERPYKYYHHILHRHFNPRSLTGATVLLLLLPISKLFQSTLPHGSDSSVLIF